MRLNINLATQPYQDVRRFLFRWGLGLAVTAVVTIVMLWAAISTTISWRKTTRQANHYREEIAKCDRERAQAEATLNRPENRSTRDQSLFINTLIARKAFSWTEVLSDLESKEILPSGIHIVGIAPNIDDSGQLELHLMAAGPSRESAIKLIANMESSPHFRDAILRSDTVEQSSEGTGRPVTTTYHFDISAIYVPSYQRTGPRAQANPVITASKEDGR